MIAPDDRVASKNDPCPLSGDMIRVVKVGADVNPEHKVGDLVRLRYDVIFTEDMNNDLCYFVTGERKGTYVAELCVMPVFDARAGVTNHVVSNASALGDRDAAARKAAPICRGVFWYFPEAIKACADSVGAVDLADPNHLLACQIDLDSPDPDVSRADYMTDVARAALLLLHNELNTSDQKCSRVVDLGLDGFLRAYASALAEIAELSRIGNEQHNPGEPMHWAREKSTDHADCIVRHMADRGTRDTDGVRHMTKVAWRALAQLETELTK